MGNDQFYNPAGIRKIAQTFWHRVREQGIKYPTEGGRNLAWAFLLSESGIPYITCNRPQPAAQKKESDC